LDTLLRNICEPLSCLLYTSLRLSILVLACPVRILDYSTMARVSNPYLLLLVEVPLVAVCTIFISDLKSILIQDKQ
jgi:hypothetical protein